MSVVRAGLIVVRRLTVDVIERNTHRPAKSNGLEAYPRKISCKHNILDMTHMHHFEDIHLPEEVTTAMYYLLFKLPCRAVPIYK